MATILRKQGYSISGGGGGSIDTSTLANKTDLTAIILTGTTNTSGDTITAGTWFYLNGTPCVAKVDIASGATFTEGTNYEEKTVGSALSELNSKFTIVAESSAGKTYAAQCAEIYPYYASLTDNQKFNAILRKGSNGDIWYQSGSRSGYFSGSEMGYSTGNEIVTVDIILLSQQKFFEVWLKTGNAIQFYDDSSAIASGSMILMTHN